MRPSGIGLANASSTNGTTKQGMLESTDSFHPSHELLRAGAGKRKLATQDSQEVTTKCNRHLTNCNIRIESSSLPNIVPLESRQGKVSFTIPPTTLSSYHCLPPPFHPPQSHKLSASSSPSEDGVIALILGEYLSLLPPSSPP
jgi:hypothetical protein